MTCHSWLDSCAPQMPFVTLSVLDSLDFVHSSMALLCDTSPGDPILAIGDVGGGVSFPARSDKNRATTSDLSRFDESTTRE